jgi:hypothetical protein
MVVSRWFVTPISLRNQSRNPRAALELEPGRTNDFDPVTFVSNLLQFGDSLLDNPVAYVLYFGCVMFVPSKQEAAGKLQKEVKQQSHDAA